jgi:hypothetical protein
MLPHHRALPGAVLREHRSLKEGWKKLPNCRCHRQLASFLQPPFACPPHRPLVILLAPT